jgi:formylglycine-generating enzyme required for sulfatase activity
MERCFRLVAWACMLFAPGSTSCTAIAAFPEPGPPTVRLVVSIAEDVPGRELVDFIEIAATASRTPGTEYLALCEPSTCRYPTDGGAAPVVFEFRPRAPYVELAVFRVDWLSGGVVQATRELEVPLPYSGTSEVQVALPAPCSGFACGPGLQCMVVSGVPLCAAVPFLGAFDDPRFVDEGVPCSRDDDPVTCPEPEVDADAGGDADAYIGDGDAEDGETGLTCTPPTGTCPEGMAYVAVGTFVMGSDPGEGRSDEEPEHVVTLSAFCIDLTEVTNAQYASCMDAGTCDEPRNGPFSNRRADYLYSTDYADFPVVNLSYDQAGTYCGWAGKRLPTEAEWEKACRGGCETSGNSTTCDELDERPYPWGDVPATCLLANFNSCMVWTEIDNDTDGVGARPDGAQSAYCLLDMSGNVREFVSDWYQSGFYSMCPDPCTDPTGPAPGTQRITRGGSFFEAGSLLKCARRQAVDDGDASAQIGFRCAMNAPT